MHGWLGHLPGICAARMPYAPTPPALPASLADVGAVPGREWRGSVREGRVRAPRLPALARQGCAAGCWAARLLLLEAACLLGRPAAAPPACSPPPACQPCCAVAQWWRAACSAPTTAGSLTARGPAPKCLPPRCAGCAAGQAEGAGAATAVSARAAAPMLQPHVHVLFCVRSSSGPLWVLPGACRESACRRCPRLRQTAWCGCGPASAATRWPRSQRRRPSRARRPAFRCGLVRAWLAVGRWCVPCPCALLLACPPSEAAQQRLAGASSIAVLLPYCSFCPAGALGADHGCAGGARPAAGEPA